MNWKDAATETRDGLERLLAPLGGKLIPPALAPAKFPAGRECETCAVRLSTYNPGPGCYVHQPRRRRQPQTGAGKFQR